MVGPAPPLAHWEMTDQSYLRVTGCRISQTGSIYYVHFVTGPCKWWKEGRICLNQRTLMDTKRQATILVQPFQHVVVVRTGGR